MNENPELTPPILEELKAALLRRQAELRQQIADLQGNENIADDIPGDEGDSSVDLQGADDSEQIVLGLQAQLADVDHAFAKFDTGTYGICERCGRPIPLARLRILPEARYDAAYEEEVESGRA